MSYHAAGTRHTYCDHCGELRLCTVYTADFPEVETGYLDSVELCADCDKVNNLWSDYMHRTNSD